MNVTHKKSEENDELSDDLEEKHNKKEHYVDIPENRILVGVMKVGDYAKGTGLLLGLTWVILTFRPPIVVTEVNSH